ncbi:MAG: PhzF family phenazine biosynthesis protein [Oscillospiraceae bacterium]|jgi:PhzF family phenazine biosynthesis protein|nr:PhzF family phenazine biosynthesis protein [Oscillospiraceae bacterium]
MKYYIVDAFAEKIFSGNPAGVCLLEEPLDARTMQSIAAENNLSETAFVLRRGDDFDLRWFTPEVEVELCGHATLASAFVISNFVDTALKTVRFNTASGILTVEKKGDLYEMDFPSRKPVRTAVTPLMEAAIGERVSEAHDLPKRLLLVVDSEEKVRNLQPNFEKIRQLSDYSVVIVTAKGEETDFVSRFFAPKVGIPEDPVTGSSHSTLIPFWSERLGKTELVAKQLSKRSGTLYCRDCGERVKIAGRAVLYLVGELTTQTS